MKFSVVVAAALLLSGFVDIASAKDAMSNAAADRALRRIVKGEGAADPVAGAALAVRVGEEMVYAGAAGCAQVDSAKPKKCARPLSSSSKMRVASISKMALAMAMSRLVEDRRVDLDRDVSDYLGWTLRNSHFPDDAITTRHLLSHLSSIRDPESYWIAAPGDFRTLFEAGASPFAEADASANHAPGAWFKYANLNYGVLAAIIETVTGERFDQFMTRSLFAPQGLDIGYNWSGVSPAARLEGASLLRKGETGWSPVVDHPDVLRSAGPAFLADEYLDRAEFLSAYRPGQNPTLFSPQGGLRASVEDLANLVSALSEDELLQAPVWRFDPSAPNGDNENGYFTAFGLGVQTAEGDKDVVSGRSLVGHPGEAYGLYSGAWLLKADPAAGRAEDIAIAFAVTGVDAPPPASAHPTFNAIEARLISLALALAEERSKDGGAQRSEPRPFDETANAMADVDAALLSAKTTGRNVIVVLGGNWCHDSRGLASKFQTPPLAALIDNQFHVVWVDVGQKDRNLDLPKRFGVDKLIGTPTVLILSPQGELLNADSVHDWRTADSRTLEDAVGYFSAFAAKPQELQGRNPSDD